MAIGTWDPKVNDLPHNSNTSKARQRPDTAVWLGAADMHRQKTTRRNNTDRTIIVDLCNSQPTAAARVVVEAEGMNIGTRRVVTVTKLGLMRHSSGRP